MEKSEVSKTVLTYLSQNLWIKAKDLLKVLVNDYKISIDKKTLNLILYELKKNGKTVQNSNYEWALSNAFKNSISKPVVSKANIIKQPPPLSEPSENKMSNNPPLCPVHQISMKEKTAKRGRYAGQKFWGCPQFPACKEIKNFSDGSETIAPDLDPKNAPPDLTDTKISFTKKIPVIWTSPVSRSDWIDEFTDIGSIPSFIKPFLDSDDEKVIQVVSQSVILTKRSKNRLTNEDQKTVAALLKKLLQRGKAPLTTIGVEKASLKGQNINQYVEESSSDNPEIEFHISENFPGNVNSAELIKFITKRNSFEFDSEYLRKRNKDEKLLGSEEEEKIFLEWIPSNFGKEALHWFVPQASLDRLLETNGIDSDGVRRVDFLFYHPNSDNPLVIEIDGEEHESSELVDQERDNSLRSIGISVIRIKNQEILAGKGPGLDLLKKYLEPILTNPNQLDDETQNLAIAFFDCIVASKIQFGIAKSIELGWLKGSDDWFIYIEGANDIAFNAFEDLIQLLIGLDRIYGTNISPKLIDVKCNDTVKNYKVEDYELTFRDDQELSNPSIFKLQIDNYSSNHHTITPRDHDSLDMIIRPSYVPVNFSAESSYSVSRRKTVLQRSDSGPVFEIFLKHIFRKKEFREHQSDAIYNSLNQDDSIVLLPTGAGKSIIYQLSGLLMPGVTLVVDPLIALIEDQIEGLMNHGIDRAVGLSGNNITREEKKRLMKGIERGQYHFILHSPERLQTSEYRSTLRALAENSLINLAVIDEAHCVSEWGHEFRPSYLNLSDNLKNFAKDKSGTPPPLIALTGTASRAVLRDVLTELKIDRSDSNLVIRPESFDRKELKFEISKTERVEDVDAVLRGTLNRIPNEFGLPKNEFYRVLGLKTQSGIIFVPNVNGKTHSVIKTLTEAKDATETNVTYYSGSAPRGIDWKEWNLIKRQNASDFKKNIAPILVSTKAFGMGIDKPNIRYTIHLGMPASIEQFYQEAGRAGRDQKPALAKVIFSEHDKDRTDSLLDPALDLEGLRTIKNEKASDRKTDDDITRILFFHLQSFSGEENELGLIDFLLNQIGPFDSVKSMEIPFWKDEEKEKGQEKAIYRLVKIGVIKDYEKEWGSKLYRIYLNAFDLDHCKNHLLEYVEASQPGRLKVFRDELDKIVAPEEIEACIKLLAKMLIDFTYDQIERSRRRAILESIQLGRNAKTDSEIRVRILSYLQEGVGKENFDSLLELTDVKLAPWMEIADRIQNPIDAGEIRGISIRSLETFPTHPGLLFVRAVSEIMCSDGDESTTRQAIYTSFKNSSALYDIDEKDLLQTIQWLADTASAKSLSLVLPLAVAFYEADLDGHLKSFVSSEANNIFNDMNDLTTSTVKQSFEMIKIIGKVNDCVLPILSELNDPEILTLIG